MKKLLALLAVVLAVVSCQKEINGLAVDSNNEAAVSLSVALPEGATRAAGADSALGAIDNGLDMGVYDIRFILEVYDMSGATPELAKERMVKCGNETTATFNFRLVPGRNYNFVVWADFVLNDSEADLHYDTNVNGLGLRAVAIKDWTAIDESRDAYTESVRVDNYNGTSKIGENGVITLTRPFAKLRVVTNDIKEMISIRPSVVKVNYFSTKFYTAFDALNENPIDQTYNGHTLTVNLAEDFYANERPEETGVQTLFADYFFAKEGDRVMFTMDVEANHGPAIPKITFNTNIPVNRNNLTTVYGPILTDANNVTVTINPAFENKDNLEDAPYYVEMISGTKTETVVLNTGNYLFDDVTIKAAGNAIEVNGDVVIDVMGVMNLESNGGIDVKSGSLVINGAVVETRGAEPNRAGILKVETKDGSAIGGSNITIQNLAGLTAKANGNHAFGIGAEDATVIIKNTRIDYVCGGHIQPEFVNDLKYGKSEPEGGAAIGGLNVTIEDSEIVKAEGGSKAAAIGNKFWAGTNIVIKNSTLGDIFGGNASAAIGGSRYEGENKHNISIEIENSTITNAVGGQAGAGIGSGYDTHCNQENYEATNNIVIKNSTIKAKGGKYAPGIGAGYHSAYLTGSIDAESNIDSEAGDDVWYKSSYTRAQDLGYGVMDPAREFSKDNTNVTFTVAGEVIPTPAISVCSADDYNKIIALDREYIYISLDEDISVNGGTNPSFGSANTQKVVVEGNDNTLTYTDSYRTYLGMKNSNGKLVFNNLNLNRETTGKTHWHDNNMKFESETEFNSVNFNKGICLDDAKTFVLNNCKITKSKVSTYGLFITAGCDVAIDGLTIDHAEGVAGRGIKIVDEDVQNPTLTTLTISNSTFKTADKAAILVGSKGGAKITLSNNNISEVKEDSSNEVWVDEDYASFVDKVNVVGGSMIIEGQSIVPITNMETLRDELTKAGQAGAGTLTIE